MSETEPGSFTPEQEPLVPQQQSPSAAAAAPDHGTFTRSPSERRGIGIKNKHHCRSSIHLTAESFAESFADPGWLDDDPSQMTLSRRFAQFLSKYKWYYPRKRGDNAPDLGAAWAFYEHVTLARYFVRNETEEKTSDVERDTRTKQIFYDAFERAPAGETEDTSLYSFWGTPENQLADFGIGIGLYFNSVRAIATICLIAGLINLPSMVYYNSSEYSESGHGLVRHWVMAGSAVCTDQEWAPCPNCTKDDWNGPWLSKDRFAEVNGLTFIKTNQCYVGFRPGFESWISLIFVFFAVLIVGQMQRHKETEFDLKQQTASDYSVRVVNPPENAGDPQEWKDYFSQFGPVACVTVVRHNGELIRALVKRRKLMLKLESFLPPGVEMDPAKFVELSRLIPRRPLWKQILCCCCADVDKIVLNIFRVGSQIKQLAQRDYHVSNVFVTFETETGQRSALRTLSVPKIDVWTNNTEAIDKKYLFENNRVLGVCEPYERSSIRWSDLNVTLPQKIYQRTITFTFTFAYIALNFYLIALAKRKSPARAAIVITLLNVIGPKIIKFVENRHERHSDEGTAQASRYIKITLLRWMNTVIVIAITTPFTAALNPATDKNNLLYPVFAIFITEMVKIPIINLTDIVGNIKRHILGPRKPNQRTMNLCFTGKKYELSERYTELTKVMFMTFFYGTIFPAAYFFAFATLTVHYLTDKWCLLRMWRQQPALGYQISRFSRGYFFTAAIIAFAIAAAYFYSGFPFDNACKLDSYATEAYQGTHYASNLDNTTIPITISAGTPNYQFCRQDFFYLGVFPALPRFQGDLKWMSEGQEQICKFYGWTSIVIIITLVIIMILRGFKDSVMDIFFNVYKPEGGVEGTSFSNVKDINAYVPEITVKEIPFPLLAFDTSGIDTRFLGWEDLDRPYEYYSLFNDMEAFLKNNGINAKGKHNFSIVKYWPPSD